MFLSAVIGGSGKLLRRICTLWPVNGSRPLMERNSGPLHDRLESLVMTQRVLRFNAMSLSCSFLIAILSPHFLGAEKLKAIPGPEVDRSVLAALTHRGVRKPTVISHIDLTEPFATITQWTFVVVQDGGQPPTELEDHGPIFLCLVKATVPDCSLGLYELLKNETGDEEPFHLFADKVVYAGQNKSDPLPFVKVCGVAGGNGNCRVATALYRYDRKADRFIRVFLNLTGRNNNEDARFVESGPLKGDVIVDNPTDNAPYTYWIEVYRAGESGEYEKILRYRSLTQYSDGNPLAVADSEMPEILHRFGLWQSGDPLPAPAHLPKGCHTLFMRRGEEWCK
jgi:hypothetical protein